uniref:Replication stress response regulator SDE2 n=1 Tax=Oryzias sinensis TaxID=183150 RepID=A0A8C8DHT7_9TELE
MRVPLEGRMEVFVVVPRSRGSVCVLPRGSVVKDVLDRFVPQQNFYVTTNGRLAPPQDPLQDGLTYRLEPRLCGGGGGFGSMLRALGAQIEKTTNREACRDLSGRRLRDVNHEKEMAEWLKKQAEREAEKEQRRLERLQRKLAAPKHQLSDPEYQRQCHHLSERLEDSVLKGLQASSGAAAADITAVKRASSTVPGGAPPQKKKAGGGAAASFWSVLGSGPFHSGVDSENPRTCSLEGTFWKVFMDQNPFRVLRVTVLLVQTFLWTRPAQSALVLLLPGSGSPGPEPVSEPTVDSKLYLKSVFQSSERRHFTTHEMQPGRTGPDVWALRPSFSESKH